MNENLFLAVVDEFSLGGLVRSVKVLQVITAKAEVDETNKGICCCDKKDTVEGVYISDCIMKMPPARGRLTCLPGVPGLPSR